MIELAGAAVRLGGKRVFGDVELRVDPGQFVAVLGPNGAGKSTLMRVILGLVRLEAGSISVLGRTPAQARGDIGYLPQRHGFDSSTRIRGVDMVRLGLDGARWGFPSRSPRPREDAIALNAPASTRRSPWSARPATPSARSASCPAASSSVC